MTEQTQGLYKDLTKVLISREEIQEAVSKLARELSDEYRGRDLICICILKGAVVFFTDLIRQMDLPLAIVLRIE